MKVNSALLLAISLTAMILVSSCVADTEEQKQTPTESQPSQAIVEPELPKTVQPEPARAPSLSVSQQSLAGNQIAIENLYLDKPGFVVIHKNVDNKPGAVVGHSELVSGEKNNLLITIDANEVGTGVFAMLHYDDNNNGIYEYPAEDKPIVVESNVISKSIIIIQPVQQKGAVAAPQPIAPKKIDDYPDTFDGTSINTEKYSMIIAGNGSLKQEDEIVMTGNAKEEVTWTILYTNKKVDFSKDFTVEVDLNMTSDVQRGDAMAIMAIEKRAMVEGKMPEYYYCEVSSSPSHGTIIRTRLSGHGYQVPQTAGKFKMSFNALKELFSCSLDGREVGESQKVQFGDFALTLRAGLHDITSGGIEKPSKGSFMVRYDNLNLIQNTEKK